MLDPDPIASRLPPWLRVALVGCLVLVASAAGLFAYRYFTLPTTLTVAAGSVDGEAARIMSSIAGRLASTRSNVRLRVVETETVLEASKAFSTGKVDLAIVRADVGDLSAARTVVLVTHIVVLIIAPPGAAIESMADLKGKTVGVVGGAVNRGVVDVLTREYDLARARVQFRDLAPADVHQAVQSRRVNALLVVMPLTEKYLAMMRSSFEMSSKRKPVVVAIESAEAIANVARAYESYDMPKGTLRGSPAIPEDDLTTLRVPIHLVAHRNVSEDVVAELAKSIMDARRELVGEFPLLAQISAPSTDKDAFIPAHPGAAAYFDGTQQDFFDKYSNALYYGPMLLGALASLLVGLWKFLGIGTPARPASALEPLYALAGRIRAARSEADLEAVEEDIDNILKAELAKYAKGDLQSGDAAALSLAAHRLEHLINRRRTMLEAGHEPAAATQKLA